jgi:hypothetical protein
MARLKRSARRKDAAGFADSRQNPTDENHEIRQ